MKRFLTITLSILFSVIFAAAQPDAKQADWQTYNLPGEEFSVEFPQAVVNRSFVNERTKMQSGFYSVFFNKTYFFVRSESEKNKKFFDSIKNYIVAHQANNSAQTVGGLNASVYTFQDADGYFNRVLEISTKRRTYLFHTLSETENNEDAARFFNSILFEGRFDTPAPETSDETVVQVSPPKSENKTTPNDAGAVANRGLGSGSGSGMGSGMGNGIGSGAPRKIETPEQTSPLRILSKPRPNYTELARQYWIVGTVRTRVTFLASGEIGAVEPITKLPFGLTRNAVETAKKISFEPAITDGKPVSVTKIVEFNFSLF
jgi:hypothetical protein